MTARIAGFVTREQAGLQRSRSVSRNITPNRGGCAPHHGGGPQRAAEPGAPHSLCISTWRAWQSFHMRRKVDGGQEWADIAYTGGYCQHGYAFAGRGSGVRTAAQGTNLGNQNFYALTWIGGATQIPTPEALDALDWWILELRQKGGAGLAVKPHSWFKNTGCPIQALRNHAALRDGRTDFYEEEDDMTPEQARKLDEVHEMLTTGKIAGRRDIGDDFRRVRLDMRALGRNADLPILLEGDQGEEGHGISS